MGKSIFFYLGVTLTAVIYIIGENIKNSPSFNNYKNITKNGSETSFAYLSNVTTFKYSMFKDLIILGDSYSSSFLNHDSMVKDVLKMDPNPSDKTIRNWPTFLTQKHPMNVYNFAVGGAPIDHDIINNDPSCYSMTEQYEFFEKQMTHGKKYTNWKSDETLMTIWFGINDIIGKSYAPIMQNYTNEEIDEMTANSMFRVVNKIYNNGIHNFLIINVPPMEKFPSYKGYEDVIKYVKDFNEVIHKHAKNFQSINPDTNVLIYNSYDEVYHIMNNKYQYNITVTDSSYYGKVVNNPEYYFWRDDSHLSNHVQSILTNDLDKFLSQNEEASQKITGYNDNNNSTIIQPSNNIRKKKN